MIGAARGGRVEDIVLAGGHGRTLGRRQCRDGQGGKTGAPQVVRKFHIVLLLPENYYSGRRPVSRPD